MQEQGMAVNRFGQTDTPKRRRAPLAPRRLAVGPTIRQPLAHIMQQEVRVGPDELERLLRVGLVAARHIFRPMAGDAAAFIEQPLAGEDIRVVEVAARSEEWRVGEECVSPVRSSWAPLHFKKTKKDRNQ